MKSDGKKVAGIILAAGTGSRMGETKQLMSLQGDTLVQRVIKNARSSAVQEIILVLGHEADKILQTVDPSGIRIIRNIAYKKGQSTSLIAGLEKVSPDCDAAIFLLADQPLVTPVIINQMITAFENSDAPITIPYCRGKRGNPVIIARSLFHRLESLTADTGARTLFKEFAASIQKVDITDEGILLDVDTPDDYKKLLSKPTI